MKNLLFNNEFLICFTFILGSSVMILILILLRDYEVKDVAYECLNNMRSYSLKAENILRKIENE